MTVYEASRIGIVPKTMRVRPSIRNIKIQALLAWGKVNGQDVTARINKIKEQENIALMVARCFKKHGYGKTTRNLLARLGLYL